MRGDDVVVVAEVAGFDMKSRGRVANAWLSRK